MSELEIKPLKKSYSLDYLMKLRVTEIPMAKEDKKEEEKKGIYMTIIKNCIEIAKAHRMEQKRKAYIIHRFLTEDNKDAGDYLVVSATNLRASSQLSVPQMRLRVKNLEHG